MQTCFLVVNKNTQISEYLNKRSIVQVVSEYSNLSSLNPQTMGIVDVDKFIYIYYPCADSDITFRSDMNALRLLLGSAYFRTRDALFILVDCKNPMLEDFIHSATRDSNLSRDKIEIVYHTGSLMLPDVSNYLTGSTTGSDTSSSYKAVYIREADTEENSRFVNSKDSASGVSAVLPDLTDMFMLYGQRANVEALSSGRVVNERTRRFTPVTDFSSNQYRKADPMKCFVIAGEKFTQYDAAVTYLSAHSKTIGQRMLIIDLRNQHTTRNAGAPVTPPIVPSVPTSVVSGELRSPDAPGERSEPRAGSTPSSDPSSILASSILASSIPEPDTATHDALDYIRTDLATEVSTLSLAELKMPFTPSTGIAILRARFNQLGYIVEFLHNIHGVELYTFLVDESDFTQMISLAKQINEQVYSVYIAHFIESSIQDYFKAGRKVTALFLTRDCFYEDFNLVKYKQAFTGTVVGEFPSTRTPLEDIDTAEFYSLAIGGNDLDI